MADESIIIEVTDKVATTPADKFRQMAEEALKAQKAIISLQKTMGSMPTSSSAQVAATLNQTAAATTKVTKAQKDLNETQAEAIARISKLVVVNNQDTVAKTKVAEAARVLTAAEQAERAASVAATQARINASNAKEIEAQKTAALAAANLKAAQTATKAARDQITAREKEAAANQKAKAAADAYNSTLAKTGNTSRVTAMQMRSIISASRDVAGSLSAGASLGTVFLQQGPQYAQAFSKEIGALLRNFGPLIGLLGTTAAAVITLGAAYNTAKEQQAQFNNSIALTGNYAGVTEDNLIQMSEGIANAAKTSIQSARDIAQAFISSGQFQREVIEQNSTSVLQLAKLTGQSAADIQKSFIQMAESPTQFAESLNKSYHFLSAAQLTQIRQLEEQGQKTKAAELVSRQLYEYLGNVADAELGPLSQGWNTVAKYISNAYVKLQQFVNGAGPTARLSEIEVQLQRIANLNDIAKNSGAAQQEKAALEAEKKELIAQVKAKEDAAQAQANSNRIQAEGYEASKRISNEYLKTVDNVNKADAAVKKFRDSIKAALAANPNDKDALAAQAKSAAIEKKLREDNMPETKKSDKSGESRALAIAKINSELQKQVDGLGVLAPQREIQQKLDQYEIDLASRKIKLNADERKSIEDKLLAIQDYARAQTETDRIFEEATGPLKTYNAVITAANALLKSGAIDQAEHAKQVTKASESYQNTIDPLRQTNTQLDQEISLLKLSQPQREIAQQMMQVENQLRAQGLSLLDAGTDALTKEGQALREKLVVQQQAIQVQQAYDSIYAQTAGSQQANAAAVQATTRAYNEGLISMDVYGAKMANLRVQAAQLRIDSGNILPGDAALASFGQIIDGYKGLLSGLTDSFGNLFTNITDGFANAIAGAIMGTESLGDALKNVAQQAVQQLIASLIKLGIQYAVNAAIGQSLGAAGVAASIAMGTSTAVAWAPAAAAVSLATLGANAGPASAGILSTNAVSMGAALAGFSQGGYTGDVPTNAVAGVVHGKEFVMNAAATQRIGVDNLQAMQDGRMNSVQSGSGATSAVQSVGSSPSISFTVINNSDNSQVSTTKNEDANGNIDYITTVDNLENALASRVSSGRGPLNNGIKNAFGLNNQPGGRRS